jgi:tryptophan synthase alpha chain
MTHLIVGYPSVEVNRQMLEIMGEVGIDLVELQMPFSEPVADGPTFVRANQEALSAGLRLDDYFGLLARSAGAHPFPHLMMGYYNTAFRLGHSDFCRRLREAGAAGFILPDLPIEEYDDLFELSADSDLCPIQLMTPTNSRERLTAIGERVSGFAYAVARRGVTGGRTDFEGGTFDFVARCRSATDLPLALGFGLRSGDDLRQLHGRVEVGIVGSALLEAWESGGEAAYRLLLRDLADARY